MDRRGAPAAGTFFEYSAWTPAPTLAPCLALTPSPCLAPTPALVESSGDPRPNIRLAAGLSRGVSRLIDHMATYQLSVNGQSRSIDVAPEMPLLWVLRD